MRLLRNCARTTLDSVGGHRRPTGASSDSATANADHLRLENPTRTRSPVIGAVALAALVATMLVSAAAAISPPARSFIRAAGPVDAPRTLIVINGGPGLDSQFTFRGLKGLASASRRVIGYDQRGVGRTPMPQTGNTLNTDYTVDAFVADLEASHSTRNLQNRCPGALPRGRRIAAAYAARHPARVRSLILAAGLPMSAEA